MQKYELLKDDTIVFRGRTLHRIKALRDFADVECGDFGGYVETKENLSHSGNCWIYNNAKVYGNARVYKNAQVREEAEVYENAEISYDATVCGKCKIFGEAIVYGDAIVCGKAKIYGKARICGHARVFGKARVYDRSRVLDYAQISDNVKIFDSVRVYDNACIFGNAQVYGQASIYNSAEICDNAKVSGHYTVVKDRARICGDAIVRSSEDYMLFNNNWSSFRSFTYTRSNKMWAVGCFYGSGEELVEKAYEDSELSGKCYEAYVELAEKINVSLANR